MALYHIQSKAAGQRKFPASVTTLSISWLQGKVEAIAIHRGEPAGTWTCPDLVEDLGRLGDVVKTAAQRTNYNGTTVSMVLAHPRLAHQLIETPPTRGNALENAIERQIERMKVFDGNAAWSFESAGESRNAQNTLLHLVPKSIIEQLVAAAGRAGLDLVSVVPTTSILRQQLPQLGLAGNEVALLVAQTGDLLTLLVGRRDGGILLGRSLDPSRMSGAGGLALEINRTLLFVNQQFGAPISNIWWYGAAATERIAELAPQLPVPMRSSPEVLRPYYWAEENARLGNEKLPNLVSSEQRNAPKRKAILHVSSLATLALLIISTGTFSVMTYLRSREQSSIRKLEQQVAMLQEQHRDLQTTQSNLARQEEMVKALLDGRLTPVPAWFLAYLGQEVPPEVRLTEASIRREGDHWNLRLAGAPQPVMDRKPGSPSQTLSNAVATLADRLQHGPFRVRLAGNPNALGVPVASPSAAAAQPMSAVSAVASWAARKPSAAAPTQSPVLRDRFQLEGSIQ